MKFKKTSFDKKTYAIRTIKQFNGFKDDTKIAEYVKSIITRKLMDFTLIALKFN